VHILILRESILSVTDIELDLDSSPVKVRVLHDLPELFLGGEKFGPLKEGEEVEVPGWMAKELAKEMIVKLLEREPLEMSTLSKIHWRESIPSSREIPPMEYDFYYKLRALINDLAEESNRDPSRKIELDKAQSQFKDIVNCRVQKILHLAAAPPQRETNLQKMTAEERALYNQLSRIVSEWKQKVLSLEEQK